MLRRLPTTLSLTPDDLAAFEDVAARRIAYLHYKKTGEDPDGLFTVEDEGEAYDDRGGGKGHGQSGRGAAVMTETEREKLGAGAGGGSVDPNDELKPLPGDKGRAVRGREERIMGVPGARGR